MKDPSRGNSFHPPAAAGGGVPSLRRFAVGGALAGGVLAGGVLVAVGVLVFPGVLGDVRAAVADERVVFEALAVPSALLAAMTVPPRLRDAALRLSCAWVGLMAAVVLLAWAVSV